jgi:hypothetical protein
VRNKKTPTGQTEAKTMEYQSNINSNSASTASNGSTSSIASNTAPGSENRKSEAIAFVVGKSIGLTTSTASADYISLYHGNAALLPEHAVTGMRSHGNLRDVIAPPQKE